MSKRTISIDEDETKGMVYKKRTNFSVFIKPYFYASTTGGRICGLTLKDDNPRLVDDLLKQARKIDPTMSREGFLTQLRENHYDKDMVRNGNVGIMRVLRVAAFIDFYNKAYTVVNDLSVYLENLDSVMKIISVEREEDDLITELVHREMEEIPPLYTFGLVKTPWRWGPVVMHAVRRYFVEGDRYYIDSCAEKQKCLELLEGPLLKKGLVVKFEKSNAHPPIPRYITDENMRKVVGYSRNSTLVNKFRHIDPSMATIYKTFELLSKNAVKTIINVHPLVRVIERNNIPTKGVMYVIHGSIPWERFVEAGYPCHKNAFYINTSVDGSYFKEKVVERMKQCSDYIIVWPTKKSMMKAMESIHPLVPTINKAQGLAMFVAQIYSGGRNTTFRDEFIKNSKFWVTNIPFSQ